MNERIERAIAAYEKASTVNQLIKFIRRSHDLWNVANEEQRGLLDKAKSDASDRLIGVRMMVAESLYGGLFAATSFVEVNQILLLFEMAVDTFTSYEITLVISGWRAVAERLGAKLC